MAKKKTKAEKPTKDNADIAVEEAAENAAAEEAAQEKKEEKPKTPEELVADLTDKLLRKTADFDNFRKRSQRDIQDARAYSKMSTIEEFLTIYDTFKMAVMATNDPNANLEMIVAGLNMIQNEFSRTFSNLGVEELDATGQEFDPNFHEAVSREPSEEIEEGKIIRQQRCGYKMGEKLLRAAMVIVSSGPATEEGGD